ncbi:hypothetical protein BYT27DRAFT_7074890, partial [Phlegmacium glaucopus]
YRLTIETATQRAIEAERIGKIHETTLKDKIEEIRTLQEKVDLMRQCSKLTKDLVLTLQKLDEKQKIYQSLNEKAESLEGKVEALRGECDIFETKYRHSRKRHDDLISELRSLQIDF